MIGVPSPEVGGHLPAIQGHDPHGAERWCVGGARGVSGAQGLRYEMQAPGLTALVRPTAGMTSADTSVGARA